MTLSGISCSDVRMTKGKRLRYEFPYRLTQQETDRQTLYWDGMQWVKQDREVWLPPNAVRTGDAGLSAALLVLVRGFGGSLQVSVRPNGGRSDRT
jgi:hypothetical protein